MKNRFQKVGSLAFSLWSLLHGLFTDIGLDVADRLYIKRRFGAEGLPFVTKTLPLFSKKLLQSLEARRLVFDEEPVLTAFRMEGRAPRLFRGYLSKIFDLGTGALLEDPSAEAVYAIRQICEYVYKLALPFDESEKLRAAAAFLEADARVGHSIDFNYVDKLRKDLCNYYPSIANAKVEEVFQRFPPRPGSGTYAGEFQDEKRKPWFVRKYEECLPRHSDRPFLGFFLPWRGFRSRHFRYVPVYRSGGTTNSVESLNAISRKIGFRNPFRRDSSAVSEVLFVPKDSRGPRTIVREPYRALSVQMAFHDWLKAELETASNRRVNFQDQQINRELARMSSMSGGYCTLDLKDASDSVAYSLCYRLFEYSPALRWALAHARTPKAKVPEGKSSRIVELNKLAGMGSGLTFPIMSLLITLAISRQVCDHYGLPYNFVRKYVYVYGDDIVVPTDWYGPACAALLRVGLQVNQSKSFVNGPFRESCGGDYLLGVDVAPVRLKLASSGVRHLGGHDLGFESGKSGLAIVGLDRHARELAKAGLYSAADYIWSTLEKALGIKLPYVTGDSPVCGRWKEYLHLRPTDSSGGCSKMILAAPGPRKTEYEPGLRQLGLALGSDLRDSDADFASGILATTRDWRVKVPRYPGSPVPLEEHDARLLGERISKPREVTVKWKLLTSAELG